MIRFVKWLAAILASGLAFVIIYDCFLLKPDEWQPIKRGYPVSKLPTEILLKTTNGLTFGTASREGIIGTWSLSLSTYEGEISNVHEAYHAPYFRFLGRARNR